MPQNNHIEEIIFKLATTAENMWQRIKRFLRDYFMPVLIHTNFY